MRRDLTSGDPPMNSKPSARPATHDDIPLITEIRHGVHEN
jgi:hypothetical protein